MTQGDWQILTVLVGGFATLAIFSFLIRENPFYRVFEHLFIGIAAGFGTVLTVKNFLWPKILVPMLGLEVRYFPDGTVAQPYQPLTLLYLLPLLFGLLFYFTYSKRYGWLAKLAIGFTLGLSGGAAFKGFFNAILPQVVSSFKPLVVFSEGGLSWMGTFSNVVFVFTLLAVMYYFFFSFRASSRALETVSVSGRWLMMVCFGAYFGSTVMARMALLVERLQFLLHDWWRALLVVAGVS